MRDEMQGSIKLTLPTPPSANRYWRTVVSKGRAMTFVSPEAKEYKRQVAIIASARELIYSEIAVTVRFYRALRSGDLDNRLKCLFDALRQVVYADDKQIVEIHAFRFDDKANPRVEVEINALGLC